MGHEIVGIAVKVGSEVTHIKEGDMVGVGAQNDSCLECGQCKVSRGLDSFWSHIDLYHHQNNRESYCDKGQVGTYDGHYYREGGLPRSLSSALKS